MPTYPVQLADNLAVFDTAEERDATVRLWLSLFPDKAVKPEPESRR